jgi:hypothetical protein
MRLKVYGKIAPSNINNVDLISSLQDIYGMKKSTIMSYWKDAVRQHPDMGGRQIYNEVCKMINIDQR